MAVTEEKDKKKASGRLGQWLILAFALALCLAAGWGYSTYKNLLEAQEQYNACQTAGIDMQEASDYLTDQARHFAMLGDPVYMENYFTEANETRRRDKAVESLTTYFGDSEALIDLVRSFSESVELMDTEYYSMRLVCEAMAIDEDLWPDEIKAVSLAPEDDGLSSEDMMDKAREILLDLNYHQLKTSINEDAKMCTQELMARTQELSAHYNRLFLIIYLVVICSLVAISILSLILLRSKHRLEAYQVELETARQAAETSSAAKSRFLFNMSHDLRTPLNAVAGFSELLEKHRYDDEQFFHDLAGIRTSGGYLLDVINNVLDMARIENGRLVPEETIVRLQEFNTRIETVFRADFEQKHLTYSYQGDPDLRPVYTDPVLISKMILNLVGNAVKYTLEGGSVSFRIEQIPMAPGTCELRLIIADTGVGMSDTFLAHAFDAFERERNTTESGVGGTGLGLGIVKGIAESLKGRVDIESEIDVGTTVTITIPARLAEEVPEAHGADEAGENEAGEDAGIPDLSGRRILLAEDNDLNAEIAQELLEDTGAAIERAEDGAVCVDMLQKADPGYYDLILMDIQMPHLNGYDAARQIRGLADPAKAGILIVAMTANAFEEDRRNAMDAGMNGFIAKPIDVDLLMKTLAEVMS